MTVLARRENDLVIIYLFRYILRNTALSCAIGTPTQYRAICEEGQRVI
ncbi:MAG: hypothetical protein RLY87_41 [Chloroflexota bacterium]